MSEQLKQLIEIQIEQAAEILRLGQKAEWEAGALRGMYAFGERVLQIIQNQQNRIDGILEAYEDVCRRNDSLMDTVRKLKTEREQGR